MFVGSGRRGVTKTRFRAIYEAVGTLLVVELGSLLLLVRRCSMLLLHLGLVRMVAGRFERYVYESAAQHPRAVKASGDGQY